MPNEAICMQSGTGEGEDVQMGNKHCVLFIFLCYFNKGPIRLVVASILFILLY